MQAISREAAQPGTRHLIDREVALGRLHAAYGRCVDSGKLQVALLSADAGFGKTAVLLELEARLQAAATVGGPRVAYGRALGAASLTNGYEPLREALTDLVKEESQRDRKSLKRLGRAFRMSAPDWLSALPLVGDVFGAAATTLTHLGDDDRSVPESMSSQLLALLERLSCERPLVLLLDDLHWADQSTVDLLFFLSQRAQGPILIVLSYRSSDMRAADASQPLQRMLWRIERYDEVTRIDLPPLNAKSVSQLAEAAGISFKASALKDITERCEGNPLFIEEYLWQLKSKGNRLSEEMPSTLSAIFAERIADLEYTELRVLQIAAVIGPIFSAHDVASLSDEPVPVTTRAIRLLCQRLGLIRTVDRPDCYTFHHGLVAEYVRKELRLKDVHDYRNLHDRRAKQLEIANALPADDLAIAQHFHEADNDIKALEYSLGAATVAEKLGAGTEALRLLVWARGHADALNAPETQLLVLLRLASVQQDLIRTDEAVASLESALQLAHGDVALKPATGYSLRLGLARSYRMEENWEGARTHIAAAQQYSWPSADRKAELELLMAEVYMSGEPRSLHEADVHLTQALSLARDEQLRAGVLGHLGFLALAGDDPDQALQRFTAAHQLAQRSHRLERRYEGLLWLMKYHIATLDLARARQYVTEAAELSERMGVAQTVAHHCRDTGRVALLEGDTSEAADSYVAYLTQMAGNHTWTSRAAMYLLLQVQEAQLEASQARAQLFLREMLTRLDGLSQLGVFHELCTDLEAASVRSGFGLAAVRSDRVQRLLDTPQARATDVIFRFHIENLHFFRRLHSFYLD